MDPTAPSLADVGVCFDRTDRFYDADGDGTSEAPWPSCTEVANTDTNGDGVADHAALGCAPPPATP
jgi:hypothetical protein